MVEGSLDRPASDGREHALDGLRGAGAIAVMGYHVFDFFPLFEGARAALLASPLGIAVFLAPLRIGRFFAAHSIASRGTISFSFYLIHFTVLTWIVCNFTGHPLSVPAAIATWSTRTPEGA